MSGMAKKAGKQVSGNGFLAAPLTTDFTNTILAVVDVMESGLLDFLDTLHFYCKSSAEAFRVRGRCSYRHLAVMAWPGIVGTPIGWKWKKLKNPGYLIEQVPYIRSWNQCHCMKYWSICPPG